MLNYTSHITPRLDKAYRDYRCSSARVTRQKAIELTMAGKGKILDSWFLCSKSADEFAAGERYRVTHRKTQFDMRPIRRQTQEEACQK